MGMCSAIEAMNLGASYFGRVMCLLVWLFFSGGFRRRKGVEEEGKKEAVYCEFKDDSFVRFWSVILFNGWEQEQKQEKNIQASRLAFIPLPRQGFYCALFYQKKKQKQSFSLSPTVECVADHRTVVLLHHYHKPSKPTGTYVSLFLTSCNPARVWVSEEMVLVLVFVLCGGYYTWHTHMRAHVGGYCTALLLLCSDVDIDINTSLNANTAPYLILYLYISPRRPSAHW